MTVMQKRLSQIKNGQKVVFRGVACMRCNRRDSKLFNTTVSNPNSIFGPTIKQDRKKIVLVNLKNGSLYTADSSTVVSIIPENGIAETIQ